jgi:hypothetical protein
MTEDPNIDVVADRIMQAQNQPPDNQALDFMKQRVYPVEIVEPPHPIAGIDSSDNILLQIPDLPGAGVAGYSFSLVISDPSGQLRQVRERAVELSDDPLHYEELLIEILYELPSTREQYLLSIADYQWRTLISAPTGQIPYLENPPLFKLRLAAARARDYTEKRATRIFLNQDTGQVKILLRDGRLGSQNCSTRYTDDLARLFVRRGIRWVGVVKQGSLLWNKLVPYHKELSSLREGKAYWAQIAPQLIWETYAFNGQWEPKTIMLGARENKSLGGVGGLWVLYSPGPTTHYVLEFNVYDMEAFRPLVETGAPLVDSHATSERILYVVRPNRNGTYEGTLGSATAQDFEQLVAPVVAELHYFATLSRISLNYPIPLADAHNRCKITADRKERKNAELIQEFVRRGFHPVSFAEFNEDPHKLFEQ